MLTKKQTARVAIAGGVMVALAVVVLIVSTIASAAEYNLVEASGAYVGAPSIGVLLGVWGATALAAAGVIAFLFALISGLLANRRQTAAN